MNISRRQWLLAMAAAALLHLCLLGLFLLGGLTTPPPQEAPRGVMVSLDSLDPGLPPPSAIESTPMQPVSPAPSAPTAVTESASPVTPEAASDIEAPATDIGPEPAPSDPAAPATTVDPAPPDSDDPAAATPSMPRIADAVTIRAEDTIESIEPDEQITAHAATLPAADDTPLRPEVSADNNGGFGSSEQATDDYIVRLRAWLSRHKQYPMAARNQQIEGTVRIYLVIDANGTVVSQRVLESSGSQLLDQAARQMLARSQPLPRMPASMRRNRLELVVPVVFALR